MAQTLEEVKKEHEAALKKTKELQDQIAAIDQQQNDLSLL